MLIKNTNTVIFVWKLGKHLPEHVILINMHANCNPVSTLLPTNATSLTEPENTDEEKALIQEGMYRKAVGLLQYLAQRTRPDILFAANYVARLNNNPTMLKWKQVKQIIRYLKGSQNLVFRIDGSQPPNSLDGYVDAESQILLQIKMHVYEQTEDASR